MSRNKALKLTLGFMSTALFLTIPTTFARADSFTTAEQGIAGISAVLDNKTDQQIQEAYDASVQKEVSPYANLGVSTASEFVNIRKEPNTTSEVVGKLYRGCAADILKTLDGGWVKIKSGDVEGYIASQFLAIGDKAEKMVDEYATMYATVNTQTLFVREKPSTESKKLTMIPIGEKYVITKRTKDWAEILLGTDDDTGSEFTGYVSLDYIKVDVEFKYAISVAEEQKIIKAQKEAEKAEKERKEKLAREKAKNNNKHNNNNNSNNGNNNSNNNNNNNGGNSNSGSKNNDKDDDKDDDKPTNHGSAKASEVVNYALKFVGNRYVWGGTSLTKGADCSGFIKSVYGDFGYSLPRTSRDQAASAGRIVSESSIQPGDLVFYANSKGRVNHVAMYIGNGKIVHAANSRQGIIVSKYNYRDVYRVRRIIG